MLFYNSFFTTYITIDVKFLKKFPIFKKNIKNFLKSFLSLLIFEFFPIINKLQFIALLFF